MNLMQNEKLYLPHSQVKLLNFNRGIFQCQIVVFRDATAFMMTVNLIQLGNFCISALLRS